MSRRYLLAAAFALAALPGSPATVAVAARATTVAGVEQQLTKEFQATYPLAADGRVRLKNINGPVRITAWERDEIRIEAVKRAGTEARLAEAEIDVQSTPEGVQIKTLYPAGDLRFERGSRDNPASVEYNLTVPRRARLESIELVNGALTVDGLAGEIRATCVNGRLTARNLAGDARLTTVNGQLTAEFDRLGAGTVSLSSVNGTVTILLPADADTTLRASTVHGSVSNDLGLPVRQGRYVGQSLAGQLGNGSARVKLDNVNGSIQIRRAAGGAAASAVTNLLGDAAGDDEAKEPPTPPGHDPRPKRRKP